MFLFHNQRLFVIELIEILLLLLLLTDHNGRLTLTKEPTTVAAVTQPKNSSTLTPFLQIQKHAVTRLTISKPHSFYYLPCIPILSPYNYYQDNQPIYCTWYRNDAVIEQLSIRKNDFFIFENGTLRLPPNEKATGAYRCKIEWDESAVISDLITVEYPVLKRVFLGQQQQANISAVEDKPLVLGCPFLSVPPARFSWYFGNDSLANDNSALILSNGTLILRKLRQEQAGKYKCVAQNTFAAALKATARFTNTVMRENATEGRMMLRPIAVGNDTFVKWSQGELETKKYFILQFSVNHTYPHPSQLLNGPLHGTLTPVEEKVDEVRRHLTIIQPLNQSAAATVLRNAEHEVLDNEVDDMTLELEEDIFSLVVDASVTGMLLQRFTRIKMRVLIITSENEFLGQDFRYVQWKIIENGTSEQSNMPFRLVTIESRALTFKFLESLNETCVSECHMFIPPQFANQEPKCTDRNISNSMLLVTDLKADQRYNLHFYNCKTRIFYGELDVKTEQDPPGTISNSKLIKQNGGLKLIWDPPVNPNGRVHHYDIRWSLDNVTHEAIVKECKHCFYKFPNVSDTAKIHVAVRVMGDTGAGAPIYFDMVRNNHTLLEEDHESSRSEVYSGIAIGSLLSIVCVMLFGVFIIFQQRRFKARAQGPSHLTTPTDINFGNLSSASGIPGDSAGGLSGGTLQQDCHEMQTLIPRSRYHIELLPEHTLEYQTSSAAAAAAVVHLTNGNGSVQVARRSDQEDLSIAGVHNLSQLPLCQSTSPERKTVQDAMRQEAKAFYIPYRHAPPNAVALSGGGHKQRAASNSELEVVVPPNSLPLVSTMPGLGGGGTGSAGINGGGGVSARRSGSLSSSSASSSSNGSSKKQFHTNFVRHSNSNDGICLLAEEEAAATLTPTSEREYAAVCLTNGFKLPADVAKTGSTHYSTNNNNSSSSSSNSSKTSGAGNKSQKAAAAGSGCGGPAKDRPRRGNGNPISFGHYATSIVPANGPAAAAYPAAVNHNNTTSKQSWPAATVAHRRAQVDPNG
ncbi:uncharacterized protein plum [Drosophila bipectinata]|uniref:uncharacterized protein plum n=1 Tax=Drosophila bipectinata TaxID=42026 RepID=UPI0038B34653